MSETITAGHLNATRLGKRITINSLHGTVVSGRLKKIRADYAIMPSSTIFLGGDARYFNVGRPSSLKRN